MKIKDKYNEMKSLLTVMFSPGGDGGRSSKKSILEEFNCGLINTDEPCDANKFKFVHKSEKLHGAS